MFRFAAELIGAGARQRLENSRDATICAVFRRSFYLETAAGDLACIGPRAIGAGPINMICDLPDAIDWQASGLRSDTRVAIARGRFVVAGQYEFDFSAARVWRPAPLSAGWTGETLRQGLDALDAAAAAYDLSDGLAALARRDGNAMPRARAAVDALGRWLNEAITDPRQDIPPEIAFLIGLGPGLTPSGDDLIGGAMIALHMFSHVEAADRLAGWALPIARRGTGKFSLAHLEQAAGGQGAEALHRVIAAITDGNEAALKICLREIDLIGHSSGWDALAGAAAVMRRVAAQPWKPRVRRRARSTARPIFPPVPE